MNKNIIFVLVLCFVLVGISNNLSISVNAAETRAAACADPNCPGFLLSKNIDEPQPNYSEECPLHYGCTVTFKNIVAHLVVTYCSECGTEYSRRLQSLTSTQIHSKPAVIPTRTRHQ